MKFIYTLLFLILLCVPSLGAELEVDVDGNGAVDILYGGTNSPTGELSLDIPDCTDSQILGWDDTLGSFNCGTLTVVSDVVTVTFNEEVTGTCASGTAFITQSTTDSTADLGTYTPGQEITLSTDTSIYSIVVDVDTIGTNELELRLGTTVDLTTTYTASATATPSAIGDLEFVLQTGSLTAGTYYFAVLSSDQTTETALLSRSDTSTYDGGSYWYTGAGDFNIYIETTTRDLTFVVKECD